MTRKRSNDDLMINIDLIIDDSSLTIDAFRVYFHLCRRADRDCGYCPSFKEIGAHCFKHDFQYGALEYRAAEAVQELIEKGFVTQQDNGSYVVEDLRSVPEIKVILETRS